MICAYGGKPPAEYDDAHARRFESTFLWPVFVLRFRDFYLLFLFG